MRQARRRAGIPHPTTVGSKPTSPLRLPLQPGVRPACRSHGHQRSITVTRVICRRVPAGQHFTGQGHDPSPDLPSWPCSSIPSPFRRIVAGRGCLPSGADVWRSVALPCAVRVLLAAVTHGVFDRRGPPPLRSRPGSRRSCPGHKLGARRRPSTVVSTSDIRTRRVHPSPTIDFGSPSNAAERTAGCCSVDFCLSVAEC